MIPTLTHLLLPLEDGIPNPIPTPPPGTEKLVTILGWVMWVVAAFCLLMAIIAGGRIASAHRHGEEGQGFKALALAVIGVIVASSAAAILTLFV